MRRFFFAVLLIVACATIAAAGPGEDADSAYQRGDYALAAQLYRPLAEQGNPWAQYDLGLMYSNGQGVPQNVQEAAKWYRKAADQGDAGAQFNLGVMSELGRGVLRDDKEAVKWYRRGAEQGVPQAQRNLGVMYGKGKGVPQDFVRAHMWSNLATTVLSSDNGQQAMKNRDLAASRMTAAQIREAQEMARRCQKTKFKECG